MRYHNYHKHDMFGNFRSLDCIVKPIEYINRAKELDGDKAIFFSTNHGYQGNIHEYYTLCKENNVKLIVGVEAYYVVDRLEKDKSNYHIVIIAKNEDGYKDINRIMSEANETGFYYKPRIDDKLLLSLNPDNVVITTACVAGRLRDLEGLDSWIIKMKNHFKSNFYLEVQNHNEQIQINHNKHILDLSNKYNIEIIHANDSHYINKEDSKYRNLFLKAKGIVYKEESNFILDYPSYDEIVDRYKIQGVLNEEQIKKSLDNTLIFDDCEGIIIGDDMKLPSISENPNQELKEILEEELRLLNKTEYEQYKKEVDYEFDIIEKTHMEDYFVLDYQIVKKGIEDYGGRLTNTGRGSAVSFLINKYLGFTNIDRLKSPIQLYPTRFMSVERILNTRSLPDIDLNCCENEPFIKATQDLLGEENCAWMCSFKPLQDLSAFRLYCKALEITESQYKDVVQDLDKYLNDEYWGEIIRDSKNFKGVIESLSFSPCSMVLYDKPIKNEIGLLRTKDGICCNLDGYNCDKYKYLKNDYLVVTVWSIIREVCKLANIDIPTIEEIENLLDDKTFKIYEDGLTCTINQADSDFATNLLKEYKPKTLEEMSAFVAAIRPGFASLLDNFIRRKPYTTGVKELDSILNDSYNYLLYQESIMKYLIWLGVPEHDTYDIIKKIAKKKFKEEELNELKIQLHNNWIKVVGRESGFEETWQVVEDASRYSFNASHSLSYAYDSLYGAYLKSHYPLEYYTVVFNKYNGDIKRTSKLTNELDYFNIKIKSPKFRYSSSKYIMDKKTNSIYKGIESIKYLNETVGEYLYSLRNNTYKTFTDLLIDLNKNINSKQLNILITLDFFEEFGNSRKLQLIYENFSNIYGKKQLSKLKYSNEIFRKYSEKETEKKFMFNDTVELLKELESVIPNENMRITDRIKAWYEYVGDCNLSDKNYTRECLVLDTETKYSPKVYLYCINSGNTQWVKISKDIFKKNKLEVGDLVYLSKTYKKPKSRKTNDGYEKVEGFDLWSNEYYVIDYEN